MKESMLANTPQTLANLKERITEEHASIGATALGKAMRA